MSISQSWRNNGTAYRLMVSECECGSRSFPPKEVCVNCGRRSNLTLKPYDSFDRVAKLLAFSHRSEGLLDIIPGLVEMNGVTFPTRITDDDGNGLEIGMEMEQTFRRLGTTPEGLIDYGTVFRPLIGKRPEIHNGYSVTSKEVGIVGYGTHIPRYRIPMELFDREYGSPEGTSKRSSGFVEKRIHHFDQDSLTMGVDASRMALRMSMLSGERIDSVYFGAVNKPYRMKSSAITIAEAIGATPHVKAHDIDSSSRGATSSILDAFSVAGDRKMGVENTLVVGSDTPRVREGEQQDIGAASGAAAFVFGKENVIANLIGFGSFSSDIPDEWWNIGSNYPSTSGRFGGEPAYFRHMVNSTKLLLLRFHKTIDDIDHLVLNYPSNSFAKKLSKSLGRPLDDFGFKKVISRIGNPKNSSTLLSLAHTLDNAGPGETILMVHYGSGGGADALLLETTGLLNDVRKNQKSIEEQLRCGKGISYHTYRKRN